MDNYQDKQGLRIPIITRDNYELQFRRIKFKLRGKGIFYTIKQAIEKYIQITNPKGTLDININIIAIESIKSSIDKLTSDFKRLSSIQNIDKKDVYTKAKVYTIDIMLQLLNKDN